MATTVDELLVRVDADLTDLQTELRKLDRKLDSTTGNMNKKLSAVGSVIKGLAPIFATYLVGKGVKSIVDVGRSTENLSIQLNYLFGSVEEGAKAFDVMAEFASKVPFSLEQIQAASAPLGAVAKDAEELNQLLELTGDVAAVTGLSFQETSLQLQRAFSAGIGAADQFRDKGVSAMLGFEQGASYSVAETIAKFEEAFGEGGKFNGAAKDLASTFDGSMSMIGDSLFNLQKKIGEAGFFDALKEEVEAFDNAIKNNDKSVEEFAQNLGESLAWLTREMAGLLADLAGFFNETFYFVKGLNAAIEDKSTWDVLNMTIDETIAYGKELAKTEREVGDSFGKIKRDGKPAADAIKEVGDKADSAATSLNNLSAASKDPDFDKAVEKLRDSIAAAESSSLGLEKGLVKALQSAKLDPTLVKFFDDLKYGSEADFKIMGDPDSDEADKILKLVNLYAELFQAKEKASRTQLAKELINEKTELEELQDELSMVYQYTLEFGDANGKAAEKIAELSHQIQMQDPFMATMIDAYQEAGKAVADSFADALVSGELSLQTFLDIASDLTKKIISKFLELAVINPIINSIFGLAGNSALPSMNLFGPSAQQVSGPFAGGGALDANQPALVGERGPELFVPHSAGNILNNMNTKNALGGGGSVVVNQSLNFALGVSDTVRAEVANMMPVINQSAVQAVTSARQRGGTLSAAFGA